MAWRVARSLDRLLVQLNTMAPRRSKLSDGSIGDAAHASRSSDHNPWVLDGATGIVTARDYTHDPANGLDCEALYQALVKSRDPRIKYVIWNRTITSGAGFTTAWARRPYTGINAHEKHLHLSVRSDKASYDDVRDWALPGAASKPAPAVTPTPVEEGPEMRVLIDNKGTMWKATDYTLRWIGTAADAAVLERAWGKAVVYNEGEIGRLRAQIEDNLAGLRSALVATADVDEEAILAKLLPVVTDALAAKAGPGMTREEVVEILQGITLKAS